MLLWQGWARGVFGRNPQSVVDSGIIFGDEESIKVQLPVPGLRGPALPLDMSRCTGFHDLPEELLEHVFRYLEGTSRKNYFAVSGVSRAWRSLGNRVFFSSPWNTPHLIVHPNQLFCLSPRTPTGSRSGMLKCFVRREPIRPGDPPGRRITMYLGKDHINQARCRFLMCAVQRSRHPTGIWLNSRGQGNPTAYIHSNFLGTIYTLALSEGISFLVDAPALEGNDDHGGDGDESSGSIVTSRPAGLSPLPPLLMSLKYKARLKGIMQPRRMDCVIPNSASIGCSIGLPQSQTMVSAPHEVSLGQVGRISAVAVLEHPPETSTGTPDTVSGLGPSSSLSNSPVVASGLPARVHSDDDGDKAISLLGRALRRLYLRPPLPVSVREDSVARSHIRPQDGIDNGSTSGKASLSNVVDEASSPECFRNKAPHWNEGLRCWCLNFRGRVKLASVKNFQLVRDADPTQRVVMQFGKVEKDVFILDFNPTALSSVQAFAVALSTFDNKLLL